MPDAPPPTALPGQSATGLGSQPCPLPCPPASCQPWESGEQVCQRWSGGRGPPGSRALGRGGRSRRRAGLGIGPAPRPSPSRAAWGPPRGHLPRRIAAVGEGQVPHAQAVECPQDAQAAVYGVAALHADKAGHPPLPEGLPDACEESWLRASGTWGCPGGFDVRHTRAALATLPGAGAGSAAGAREGGPDRDPPALLVTHTKVSGYI